MCFCHLLLYFGEKISKRNCKYAGKVIKSLSEIDFLSCHNERNVHMKENARIDSGLWFQLMRNFKRISRISIPVNLPREVCVFYFNFALSIKRRSKFSFFAVKKVHEYRSIAENLLTLRLFSDSSL